MSKDQCSLDTFKEMGDFLVKEGMRPSSSDSNHTFQVTGLVLKDMGYTRPEIKMNIWYTGSIENGFEKL